MIAQVALPLPIAKTFTYYVPEALRPLIRPFQRVLVPFRNRDITGYVIDIRDTCEEGLKEIFEIIDLYPLIDNNIMKLCIWSSNHYITPIGLVLKYAIPKYLKPEKYLTVDIKDESCDDFFPKDIKGRTFEKTRLILGLNNTAKYLHEGKIILRDRFTNNRFYFDVPLNENKNLNVERTVFTGGVQSRIEYYIRSIEKHLKDKKNVLILLPDYDLTGRFFYELFVNRFGKNVFWYGSSVKQGLRMETYFIAKAETGNIILGNKSCIFLPILDLSLIIVERPEEDSFRNESEFKFNAWEVAIKRAEIENISLIFGSAAPPIDLHYMGDKERFKTIEGTLPSLKNSHEIKMDKKVFFSGLVPDELSRIIENSLTYKKSIAIFTPRKYYSAQIQCINCGYFFVCSECNSILSYTKREGRTTCPQCLKESVFEELCPQCKSTFIRFYQFGAEYMEEILKKRFYSSDVILLTGDNIEKHIKHLFNGNGDKKIIVGTHVLSRLYTIKCDVLIFLYPEDLLNMAGYRAEEKLFQIILNTVDALNPFELYFIIDKKKGFTIEQFKNYADFYRNEIEKRRLAEFPPFNNIYLIELEKKTFKAGERALKNIIKLIKTWGFTDNMQGPLFKKKGGYNWRIILKDHNNRVKKLLFSLYDIQNIAIEVNPPNI